MGRFAAGSIAVLLAALTALQPDRPARVLFIGNSYTFFNNLPCLVSELAKSRGRAIDSTMIAEGGAALGDHLNNAATRELAAQRWDAIILQTQSTFGPTYLVDGVDRIADTSSLLSEARPFAETAARTGARVFLYEHWRRLAAPERDQTAIARAFADAAKALGARVIPAGAAWTAAARAIPEKTLYYRDGSHPSEAGSYLTAVTAYTSITGDDPDGLPSSLTCPAVDLNTEKVTERTTTLRLEPALARTLQGAAAEAVRDWEKTVPETVPPIALPQLAKGDPIDVQDLRGTWVGTTTVYPRALTWPARLSMSLLDGGTARVTISFGGKPDDIVRDATFTMSAGVLQVTAPNGPNGTIVRYRGVRQGAGLTGVVEFTGNADVYAIGTWRAQKAR